MDLPSNTDILLSHTHLSYEQSQLVVLCMLVKLLKICRFWAVNCTKMCFMAGLCLGLLR